MTRAAKYIIYDDGLNDVAVIFPNHVNHNNMAMMLGCKPISAGFVEIDGTKSDDPQAVAFGHSVSLGLKSRPEDSKIIQKMLVGN